MNVAIGRIATLRSAAVPTERLCPRFTAGVALCDGGASTSFGDGLFAVPIRTLWETT